MIEAPGRGTDLLSVGSHGEGQREGQRQRKEDVWDGVCAIIFIIIIIIIIITAAFFLFHPSVRVHHEHKLKSRQTRQANTPDLLA